MFLVGILTFKIVVCVCVCHIEMSIYRNKREVNKQALLHQRKVERENRCDITNNTLNRPAFTQNSAFVYDKHANILSPLFCVVSRGSPIFSIYESAVAAVVTSAAFPLRELLLLQLQHHFCSWGPMNVHLISHWTTTYNYLCILLYTSIYIPQLYILILTIPTYAIKNLKFISFRSQFSF